MSRDATAGAACFAPDFFLPAQSQAPSRTVGRGVAALYTAMLADALGLVGVRVDTRRHCGAPPARAAAREWLLGELDGVVTVPIALARAAVGLDLVPDACPGRSVTVVIAAYRHARMTPRGEPRACHLGPARPRTRDGNILTGRKLSVSLSNCLVKSARGTVGKLPLLNGPTPGNRMMGEKDR